MLWISLMTNVVAVRTADPNSASQLTAFRDRGAAEDAEACSGCLTSLNGR
jgi:hypothetical protein